MQDTPIFTTGVAWAPSELLRRWGPSATTGRGRGGIGVTGAGPRGRSQRSPPPAWRRVTERQLRFVEAATPRGLSHRRGGPRLRLGLPGADRQLRRRAMSSSMAVSSGLEPEVRGQEPGRAQAVPAVRAAVSRSAELPGAAITHMLEPPPSALSS